MSAPLDPLELTGAYIRVLAYQQEQAARAVWEAVYKPVNVNENVKKTHGTVCDDTYKALKRAEEERNRAGARTQSQSEDLAVKLEHAAAKYDGTDGKEGEAISGTMRPGG